MQHGCICVIHQNACVMGVSRGAAPVGVAYYKRRAVQYYTSLQRTFDPHLGNTREWLDQYLFQYDMRLPRGWMRWAVLLIAFISYNARLVRRHSGEVVIHFTTHMLVCVSAAWYVWIGVVCMMFTMCTHIYSHLFARTCSSDDYRYRLAALLTIRRVTFACNLE
jgi:hypothetical protein